jgi:2-dehydropantoate 2-reductase
LFNLFRENDAMETLIYGGGAVGLGIASCLLKAGQEVLICAREEAASILRREGLIRTGMFGKVSIKGADFEAVSSLDEVSNKKFDYILVCTKSFDSEPAAKDIHANRDLLKDGGCIVLFQNGWGNAEVFTRLFPRETIYNARVITGFVRPRLNRVDITVHADAIHVGSLYTMDTRKLIPLCEAIAQGDIPCTAVSEIEKDLWAKMLFNCPLNALGAIFGVPYGTLGQNAETKRIMEMIIREVFLMMEAGEYSTYWHEPEEYITLFYKELIPRTAEHHASTLQDLRAGKRTEIDALNGAIVELGKKYGIAVPANAIVYHMIKFMETQS